MIFKLDASFCCQLPDVLIEDRLVYKQLNYFLLCVYLSVYSCKFFKELFPVSCVSLLVLL